MADLMTVAHSVQCFPKSHLKDLHQDSFVNICNDGFTQDISKVKTNALEDEAVIAVEMDERVFHFDLFDDSERSVDERVAEADEQAEVGEKHLTVSFKRTEPSDHFAWQQRKRLKHII